MQYSDLVKDQYANSSDQMKKIIDRYSDTEQTKRPQRLKFQEFYSPRPKTMTRQERNKTIYQNLPQSPIPKNREHLVIKNNENLWQLDDLQCELNGFKRSLFIMKQKNNQMRKKQNLKKPKNKYDIFG
ncbi:hypothetical protein FGO68_gene16284 [Halteria grandinella]|uniref:Uncharacterized protein n=1 Tax=Halteria grandinella TaxID=5974 RepID=A0A8J8SYA9_HALGN|nr:hypothetical protein FGO68_gene16284 [Halteria grandinella]